MNEHETDGLTAGLRALRERMEAAEQAPAALEAALLGEFRRERKRRELRAKWYAGALAASLAMAAFLGYRTLPATPESPLSPGPRVAAIVQAVKQESLKALELELAAQRPVQRAETVKRGPASAVRPAAEGVESEPEYVEDREVATAFYPVAGGDVLAPLNRGRVIRVHLPRSSLRGFGLPMNEDRAGERVKADLLLGDDGMARAIRFVQ